MTEVEKVARDALKLARECAAEVVPWHTGEWQPDDVAIRIALAMHARLTAEIARLRGALLSGRERAIAARNFLAINAPSHADRHLAEAIADYTRKVPEIVQAHDDTIRAAIAQQGGDDGQG